MTNAQESLSLHLLADQINEHHRQARIHAESAIDHALSAGESLLKAKAAAGHGNWRAWLSENTEIPERTAQRYMLLAQNRNDLEAKVATVADLTITGALRLLTNESDDQDELSEKKRRDFIRFMARCRRNRSEMMRIIDKYQAASEARDIEGLKEVIDECDQVAAEDRACRRYAERKIRELVYAA